MIFYLIDKLWSLVGRIAFSRRTRQRGAIRQLQQSQLFNAAWYLETYQDVCDSGVDPITHYLESGWREGRDPGPEFSTTAYLRANVDVADRGMNPLLHYIEHGHSEGRGTPDFGSTGRSSIKPDEAFGPAAPCASFRLARENAEPWARSGRLADVDGSAIQVEGLTFAILPASFTKARWQAAIDGLASLSGWNDGATQPSALQDGQCLEILDAWHTGRGTLRMRWLAGAEPTVVRAIQQSGSLPSLVGEAPVNGDLDVLDVRLANEFSPLLFVFTSVDGVLQGIRYLTFPALCRGGLHYPELVAIAQGEGPRLDVGLVDRSLGEDLLRLRGRAAPALISDIAIDVECADGTEPLFQPQYKLWIARVFGVTVRAVESDLSSARLVYLAEAAANEAPNRGGMGTLRLPGGMIPSISALVASSESGDLEEEIAGSFIVSGSEPSGASTRVHVPAGTKAKGLPQNASGFPTIRPRNAHGLPGALPTMALRLPRRRALTDSEFFYPSVCERSTNSLGPQITWLIWPSQWQDGQLADALEALSRQTTAPSRVVAIGPASASASAVIAHLSKPRRARTLDHALSSVKTPLVGYLGPGIILHDRRTLEHLFQVLTAPDSLTASAAVISVGERGNGWSIKPLASGPFPAAHGLLEVVAPMIEPPQDFWITKIELLAGWLRGGKTLDPAARHYCSTRVTVSKLATAAQAEAPIRPPAASADQSVWTELVVG